MTCIPTWLFWTVISTLFLGGIWNFWQGRMWMRLIDKKNATIDRLRYAREVEDRAGE